MVAAHQPRSAPVEPPRALTAVYLALVASLPFLLLSIARVGGAPVTVTDALFLLTAAGWTLAVLLRKAAIRRSGFYLPLAAYAAAIVISAIFSEAPRRSLMKAAIEFYLIGLAVLTFNLVPTMRALRRTVGAWLVSAGVSAAAGTLGVILFWSGIRDRARNPVLWNYGSLPPGNYPRLRLFFENGNMGCNYLVISAALVLWAAHVKLVARTTAVALYVTIGISAAFTISPGLGGVALVVGIWMYLRTRGTPRRLLGRVALAGSLVAALAFLVVTSVSLTPGKSGLSVRTLVWIDSAKTFLADPITGRGVGLEAASVFFDDPSGNHQHLREAHNIYLSVAAQEGILGLLGFGSILVYLLIRWRRLPAVAGHQLTAAQAAGAALIGAVLFQGLTGALEDTRHVWVLIGLLASVCDATFEGGRAEGGREAVAT